MRPQLRDNLMVGLIAVQIVQFVALVFVNTALRDLSAEVTQLYAHLNDK